VSGTSSLPWLNRVCADWCTSRSLAFRIVAAVGFVLGRIAPIPLRHEIADHVAKEALVRQSGLDWTIVRPPKLNEGPYTGRYLDGENISTRKPVPMLSRADAADFVLRSLENPLTVGKVMRLLPGTRA
jgi:hypothetical protein